jgi:hypothetical protein
MFHIRWVSIFRFLHFNFLSDSFCITFLFDIIVIIIIITSFIVTVIIKMELKEVGGENVGCICLPQVENLLTGWMKLSMDCASWSCCFYYYHYTIICIFRHKGNRKAYFSHFYALSGVPQHTALGLLLFRTDIFIQLIYQNSSLKVFNRCWSQTITERKFIENSICLQYGIHASNSALGLLKLRSQYSNFTGKINNIHFILFTF